MPSIQIYSYRTLAHSQLVHSHCSIIYHTNPTDDTAAGSLEAANLSPSGTHLSEIHSHTAAIFGNIRKLGNALINAVQRIRNRINKAGA